MNTDIERAAFQVAHITALSRHEPLNTDIGTVVEISKTGVKHIQSAVHSKNTAGYIPIYSIGIGGRRICENLISLIKDMAMTILFQQSPVTTFVNLKNSTWQILRGAIEIVPIIGNLTIYNIDRIRIKMIERHINQHLENKPDTRNYYANGRVVFYSSLGSYDQDFNFMGRCGARFS